MLQVGDLVTVPNDHYSILGVAPEAGYEVIRRAWISAARANHPDAMVDAPAEEARIAEIRMLEINEAWRVLGSEELRKAYDKERHQKNKIANSERQEWEEQWYEEDLDLDDSDFPRFEVRNPIIALILRALPWLLIAATGVTILVFSAFATGSAPRQIPVQECLSQSDNGEITKPFGCDQAGALLIVREIKGPIEGSYCRNYAGHPNAYRISDPQEANKNYCVESISQ